MSRMRDVTVDPEAQARARRARVPAQGRRPGDPGARAGDAVLGFISEVGVAGLTLGGGLGYLTRRFGWTVDNLEEVEIVTADGEIRTANRDENADLFWALRGGGGNFGVVTRFTFRLHEVGPTVYGGLIAWPFERADEILHAYRTITTEAPRELTCSWSSPRPAGAVRARGVARQADLRHGRLLQRRPRQRRRGARADPSARRSRRRPAPGAALRPGAVLPRRRRAQGPPLLLEDRVRRRAERRPAVDRCGSCSPSARSRTAEVGFLHLGGALNEHEEDDGAVGNRDARYALGVKGMWEPDEPNADAFRQWVRDAWERIRPFSTGRTYINFQTADEDQERIRATYGANFDRLVEIKKHYDPDNLFRVNRNIHPSGARRRAIGMSPR